MTLSHTRPPAREALRVNLIIRRAKELLSQEQLARRAGVSRPTISRIERGVCDVGIDAVQRLADAFGVSVSSLFLLEHEEPANDRELSLRASSGDNEFIGARALISALDEAAVEPIERYSRAGRPALGR